MIARRIIWIALSILGIIGVIVCIMICIQTKQAEIAAQIAANGFYKDDIWISLERHNQFMLLMLPTILSFISIGVGAIGFMINVMNN